MTTVPAGMKLRNLYATLPPAVLGEVVETLIRSTGVDIERIVSHGESTPPGQWYDQDRDEWVVLLRGGAGLRFEGDDAPRVLTPGDYLNIPAHVRHRVEWTAEGEATVWVAVRYR
jgi:cupin 2 domain-containing protein